MAALQSIPRIANAIQPRAVASGPTAEQVQTQSLAGGTDRPEVEISASARVRAAARADLLGKDGGFGSTFGERRPELEATRAGTATGAGLLGSSEAGASTESSGDLAQELERSQLVAVRVGVAPPPILGEGVTEAGLRQRAVLRDLGSLFTLPELDAERREAADVQGRSDTAAGREAAQKIELLGDPAKPEPQAADALGQSEPRQPGRVPASPFAARDAAVPRPAPTPESERAAELAGTQSPEVPVLGDPEQPDATTSIPAAVAGVVRDPAAVARPVVLPGSGKSESDAVRPAERTSSQFGAVEADGGEELIARFLGDARSEDRSRGDAREPSREGNSPVRDSGRATA